MNQKPHIQKILGWSLVVLNLLVLNMIKKTFVLPKIQIKAYKYIN